MRGIQHIEVSNRAAKFSFELYRNITVVRGDSGTGKTTLFNMIADHMRLGAASGVNLKSTKPCVALTEMDWKHQLSQTKDSIVFIDEGNRYLASREFSEAIRFSDNYYVIFNREGLHELPYSVEEIYRIHTSGKYHTFRKLYTQKAGHLFCERSAEDFSFGILLTEDSHSGYDFYCAVAGKSGVQCGSTASNSAVFPWLLEHPEKKVLIIADGAAFGSEIDRVAKLMDSRPGMVRLCLPESFEWLILKSGLIKAEGLPDVLENTSAYVSGTEYFSWEQFFEQYLVQETRNTPFQYGKSKLNPVYLIDENMKQILKEIAAALEGNSTLKAWLGETKAN